MVTEELYVGYVQALVRGDRQHCADTVTHLLAGGIDVKSLYVGLIQRSMYEIGSLWQSNRVSVATEHLATSITEGLLSLVYPAIFSQPHINRTAIVSCAANEFHQLGGRMVADTFELNRWHGHFLGANTPADALVEMIGNKQPDLVALSLSVYFSLPSLVATIETIRAASPELPILLGGQAFRWGGHDIAQTYPGVRVLDSLDDLELLLRNYPVQ